VVERHAEAAFPCQTVQCTTTADFTARVPAYGLSVVVLLCDACAKKLPEAIKPVPLSKEPR
jgi:hypothetical protein